MVGWTVVEEKASAGDLHNNPPDASRRLVRVCSVTGPALVLGSAQRVDDAARRRAASLGFEVVARRSGGGAVLLAPGAQVWVDVTLPRGDALWTDDVSRSGWWLGDAWAGALESLGVVGATVHKGPMVRSLLSGLVCFAGLGPGEVTVGAAKVMGVSQRRTRQGAVFQCTIPLSWDPSLLVEVLALGAADAAKVATAGLALSDLIEPVTAETITATLVTHLP